jgi:CheY-like chemotaxis protein
MQRPSLDGRSILVVEDEPLIAMDIAQAFEATGAALTTTNTLHHAMILVEHDGLSGAILDHSLGDGDSSLLCTRLKERGIPFMIYSGHARARPTFPSQPPRVSSWPRWRASSVTRPTPAVFLNEKSLHPA